MESKSGNILGNNQRASSLNSCENLDLLQIVLRLEDEVKLLKQESRSAPPYLKLVTDKLNALDRLESKLNSSIDLHGINVDVSDWNKVGIASTVSRMREEINSSSMTTRIDFESRLEELRLCLDRNEKMISSRPKMSEFQQIQGEIEETNNSMRSSLASSVTRLERSVNSRVASEFDDLSSWKRQNERLTQERFESVNKVVQNLSTEMAGLRDTIMNLKCDLGLKLNTIESQIDIKLIQLTDTVAQLTQDQLSQEKRLSEMEDKANEMNAKVEEVYTSVFDVRNILDQKFGDVDRLLGDQMSSSGNLSQSISDIQNMVNINLLPKIDKMEEKLSISERQLMDQRYQIQNHTTLLKKTESTLVSLDQMDSVSLLTRVKENWDGVCSKLDKTNLSTIDCEALISVLTEKSTAMSTALSSVQIQVNDSGAVLTSTDKQCSTNCESIRQLDNKTAQAFDVLKQYGEQVSLIPDLVRHADEINISLERMQNDFSQARDKHDKEVGKLSQVSQLVDKLKKDTMDTIKNLSVSVQNQADAAQASSLQMLGPSLDDRIERCVNRIMFGDENGGSGEGKDTTSAAASSSSSSSTVSSTAARRGSVKGGKAAGGGLMAKSGKKNPLDMTENERMNAIRDFAESLAEVCIGYEKYSLSLLCGDSSSGDESGAKKKKIVQPSSISGSWPPALPPNLLQEMALIAGDSAEFISKCSDGNAIIKSISISDMVFPSSTALGSEVGDNLTGDLAEQERLAMTSSIRSLIAGAVEHLSPMVNVQVTSTTSTRRECRVSCLTKISNVIDMSLSKYDSVTVMNHSNFGRIKIPTCIACDRPLIGRLRPRATADIGAIDNLPLIDEDKNSDDRTAHVPSSSSLLLDGGSLVQSASTPSIISGNKASKGGKSKGKKKKKDQQQQPLSSEASIFTDLTASLSADVAHDTRSVVDDLTLSSKEPHVQTFVYRGGFKMPRTRQGEGKTSQQDGDGASVIFPAEMQNYSIVQGELPSI